MFGYKQKSFRADNIVVTGNRQGGRSHASQFPRLLSMVTSVEIPQDIIDSVIEAVGDDKHLLKQCTLVSSSFLLPSRKQLFSRITLRSDKTSQGIHQFLLQYPVIQSFVRSITLSGVESKWVNGSSLLAILRLPFRRLECFSIQARNVWDCWNWNSFSSELRDALSNIMLSSTLKTLSLAGISEVPISFFIHIVHLTTLELYALSPEDFGDVGDITTLEFYSPSLEDFGDQNSSSLTRTNLKGVAPTVIDRCVWHFPEGYNVPYYGTRFLLHLLFFFLTNSGHTRSHGVDIPAIHVSSTLLSNLHRNL